MNIMESVKTNQHCRTTQINTHMDSYSTCTPIGLHTGLYIGL